MPLKVLLVDDDAQQLATRAHVLKISGFSVVTTCSPLEAILMLAGSMKEIDVAILDHEMPVMDGCTLACHIRAACPGARIILYSGALNRPRAKMTCVDLFIPKGKGIGQLIGDIVHLAQTSASACKSSIRATHAYFRTGARILIADDHALVLAFIAELLARHHNVIGTVRDGVALLEAIGKLSPDVAVVDIAMPEMHGLAIAERIRKLSGGPKLVFVTVYEDAEFIRSALSVGVLGYVVKHHLVTDLPLAVEAALAGQQFISPSLKTFHQDRRRNER